MKQNRNNDSVSFHKTNLLVILLAAVVIVNLFIFSKVVRADIPPAEYPKQTEKSAQSVKESDEKEPKNTKDTKTNQKKLKKGYQTIEVSAADIHSGNLILINAANAYVFDNTPSAVAAEELVSVYSHKTKSYKVKDVNTLLNLSVLESLNAMMDEFQKQTDNTSVMVVSAYRGEEEQQDVLESKIAEHGEADGKQIASEPGHSEHHSGYAFDFTIYHDNGKTEEYDGTGDTEWIAENCARYGFILRYPEGKTDITGIQYEPWHFRYVGIPHATYLMENGLVLEEYIDLLKEHPYGSDPLAIDIDGTAYEVYFVPTDEKITKIPVPKNADYTVSGNNADGLIVTVKRQGEAS